MLKRLDKFLESAHLNLITGVVLLYTSGTEIVQSVEVTEVGAHHGVGFFAIVHILKAIKKYRKNMKDTGKNLGSIFGEKTESAS